MTAALDSLMARLNAGDEAALKQMFVAFEPYMRMVVRRRIAGSLRAKFDSADVVQSVWADVVQNLRAARWKFENLDQFRALLMTMTRNRFIDRLRKHQASLRHEVSLPKLGGDALPADRCPRVSENFYADELWQQMIEVCPSAHLQLLAMKRQGATIAEIARRCNLHEGSVRRILYDVARRVAELRKSPSTATG
jgi:RNA polymerase sigma factor (sigma-70 family)